MTQQILALGLFNGVAISPPLEEKLVHPLGFANSYYRSESGLPNIGKFGWTRKDKNQLKFHGGVDLSVDAGNRVYAIADGVVIKRNEKAELNEGEVCRH